jgi:hypothetical protein
LSLPPAVYDGTAAAAECGGVKRLALLEEIDGHCERLPRVDYLEFHQRIHRRMTREVAGMAARGLPSWWRARLQSVSKAAEDPVPDGAVRVFRLPMGGWLFRAPRTNFVADAAGADLAEYLWNGAGLCVLTQPLDITRRNDQLLLRMALAEPPRTAFHHVVFHLPAVPMEKMAVVEPGKSYGEPSATRVHALGKKQADGAVTWSCSYRVEMPDGPRILLLGPDLRADEVEPSPIDLAIVSPRNPELVAIVRKLEPRLVMVDDAFTCQAQADLPRVSLRTVHAVQEALRPVRSVLLARREKHGQCPRRANSDRYSPGFPLTRACRVSAATRQCSARFVFHHRATNQQAFVHGSKEEQSGDGFHRRQLEEQPRRQVSRHRRSGREEAAEDLPDHVWPRAGAARHRQTSTARPGQDGAREGGQGWPAAEAWAGPPTEVGEVRQLRRHHRRHRRRGEEQRAGEVALSRRPRAHPVDPRRRARLIALADQTGPARRCHSGA